MSKPVEKIYYGKIGNHVKILSTHDFRLLLIGLLLWLGFVFLLVIIFTISVNYYLMSAALGIGVISAIAIAIGLTINGVWIARKIEKSDVHKKNQFIRAKVYSFT